MLSNKSTLSTLAFLISLIPNALSAPTTAPRARDIGPGNSVCAGQGNKVDPSAASDYALYIDGAQQVDAGLGTTPDDCGHGFLDNLHGQCGLGIINWTCNIYSGGYGISFTAPVTCQGYQIQNALWLATNPHMDGVTCSWVSPDYNWAEGGTEIGVGIIEGLLEGLGGEK